MSPKFPQKMGQTLFANSLLWKKPSSLISLQATKSWNALISGHNSFMVRAMAKKMSPKLIAEEKKWPRNMSLLRKATQTWNQNKRTDERWLYLSILNMTEPKRNDTSAVRKE